MAQVRIIHPKEAPKPQDSAENMGWITVRFADFSIPTHRQWGTVSDVSGVKKFWQSQVLCGVVVEFAGKARPDLLSLILGLESKLSTLARILE